MRSGDRPKRTPFNLRAKRLICARRGRTCVRPRSGKNGRAACTESSLCFLCEPREKRFEERFAEVRYNGGGSKKAVAIPVKIAPLRILCCVLRAQRSKTAARVALLSFLCEPKESGKAGKRAQPNGCAVFQTFRRAAGGSTFGSTLHSRCAPPLRATAPTACLTDVRHLICVRRTDAAPLRA
jgi:hypothetical protein